MDKLSVIIITYNESRNIERCLKSVEKVADEIVVVDSFSTDDTETICRSHGVNFYQRKWDDFSSQKNYANEKAAYDYILSIDADEVLSDALVNSIKKAKERGFQGAYYFSRLTYFCGHPIRHCGWYPDRKLRIWNRHEAHWNGLVHEELVFETKPETTLLKGDLLHFTIEHLEEHTQKMVKYTNYRLATALENGKTASFAQMIFKPAFKFFKIFILKAGFLDGYMGYVIAKSSAYSRFIYLSSLRIEQEKRKRNG